MYDGAGFARHLFDIRTMALLRVLMDQGIYVGMMVFAAGLRHLVRHARPESEWLGTLTFGGAAVWLAVTLVTDGWAAPSLIPCEATPMRRRSVPW